MRAIFCAIGVASIAPLYLPGFFQEHNIQPFQTAYIAPPDSEHPHHGQASILVGQSLSSSGLVVNTAVDLSTGKVLSDYKPVENSLTETSRTYSVEAGGIRSLSSARPWRIAFDSDETVVSTTDGAIFTSFPAKTTPDGQAAWKFLLENSACILTQTAHSTFLRVFRTDNGELIGIFEIESFGQAKVVYRDNTIIIHGWSKKFLRHEIYVIGLFWDGKISVSDLIFGRAKTSHILKADIKKFIFPHGEVRQMEITKTRKFLSPATVIFALADGRVVRKLLPALVEHPDANGVVDFEGVEILTRGFFLDDVKMVISGPTMLESTSAVVVIGNFGLHISSVASPLAFDSLGEGFDREMLATSIAVVGAIFVISEVLARRALKLRKWK